jgi:enoyl-[acyl-carrier protein] reductase I
MNDSVTETTIARGTLMQGKRGVVMGVANNREVAFTYQGETLEKRVRPLAASVNSDLLVECDVSDDNAMDEAFGKIAARWGKIDFLVHAIGFADRNYLRGRFLDTPREAFLQAMDISCYSFAAVGRRAAALMPEGGSLLTLTYLGAERVVPHYNVMGVAKAALEASVRYMAADLGASQIRVNAISAGPIRTLAAAGGIGDFHYIMKWNKYNAPLERNVELEEVGGAAVYMLSDLSKGVTGEVHHVDCGYHIVGMKNPTAPDIGLAPD